MIDRMKYTKEALMNCVQGQLGDLSSVDTKELGEAIDMIKDLSEAIYYCTITESMEESKKEKEEMRYYPSEYYRDMDRSYGSMYYSEGGNSGSGGGSRNYSGGSRGYSDGNRQSSGESRNYPIEIRDYREGRSPMTRKNYMERKMHGGGKEAQIYELEKYTQELTKDITEMMEGASPEEKQMMQKKLSVLTNSIV